VQRAKKGYEANKQSFPKVGTPEYQSVQQQWLAILVQRDEYDQAAAGLGITATSKDIDKAVNTLIKTRFGGDRKKFEQALKQQGFTEQALREIERTQVLGFKIFQRVTKNVHVSDAQALAYYTQNAQSYGAPESRDVRHILIAVKGANGQVDYAKSKAKADQIRAQVTNANFASLVKRYSDDPGSKSTGGKYTEIKGQFAPEFEKAAFALKTGEISTPVKTQFGYHIIQALGPLKPAKVTPFSKVKASIKATLLQQKRNDASNAWYANLQKKYKHKVSYATGFAPPAVSTSTTTTT